MNDTIRIDISKDTLDAYWLSQRQPKQFANSTTGLRALIRWIRQAEASLVVFEATGVYHRLLETGLATHGIPFARVNPRQARRFAGGTGQLAKTDRVDAAILARMGSLLELEADQPRSQTQHDLKQLATARQALIKERTAARARLQRTRCLKSNLRCVFGRSSAISYRSIPLSRQPSTPIKTSLRALKYSPAFPASPRSRPARS
jgi:transposase